MLEKISSDKETRVVYNYKYDVKGYIYSLRLKPRTDTPNIYDVFKDVENYKYKDATQMYAIDLIFENNETLEFEKYDYRKFDLKYIKSYSYQRSLETRPATLDIVLANPVQSYASSEFTYTKSQTITTHLGQSNNPLTNVRFENIPKRYYDIFDPYSGIFRLGIQPLDYIELYEAKVDIDKDFEESDYKPIFRGFITTVSDDYNNNEFTVSINAESILSLFDQSQVVTNQAVFQDISLGNEEKSPLAYDNTFSIRLDKLTLFKDIALPLETRNPSDIIMQIISWVFRARYKYSELLKLKKEDVKPPMELPISESDWIREITELNSTEKLLFSDNPAIDFEETQKYNEYHVLRYRRDSMIAKIKELKNKLEKFTLERKISDDKKETYLETKPDEYQANLILVLLYFIGLYENARRNNEDFIELARIKKTNLKGFELSFSTDWETVISSFHSAIDIFNNVSEMIHYVCYEDEIGRIIFDYPQLNGDINDFSSEIAEKHIIDTTQEISSNITYTEKDFITTVINDWATEWGDMNDPSTFKTLGVASKTYAMFTPDELARYGFRIAEIRNINIFENVEFGKLHALAYKALNNVRCTTLTINIPNEPFILINEPVYVKFKGLMGLTINISKNFTYGSQATETLTLVYLRRVFVEDPLLIHKSANDYTLTPLYPEYLPTYQFMDAIPIKPQKPKTVVEKPSEPKAKKSSDKPKTNLYSYPLITIIVDKNIITSKTEVNSYTTENIGINKVPCELYHICEDGFLCVSPSVVKIPCKSRIIQFIKNDEYCGDILLLMDDRTSGSKENYYFFLLANLDTYNISPFNKKDYYLSVLNQDQEIGDVAINRYDPVKGNFSHIKSVLNLGIEQFGSVINLKNSFFGKYLTSSKMYSFITAAMTERVSFKEKERGQQVEKNLSDLLTSKNRPKSEDWYSWMEAFYNKHIGLKDYLEEFQEIMKTILYGIVEKIQFKDYFKKVSSPLGLYVNIYKISHKIKSNQLKDFNIIRTKDKIKVTHKDLHLDLLSYDSKEVYPNAKKV